jgi:hypothetical protein
VFAFGYTGGWSYFLGRPNPSPAPQGFRLTYRDADTILSEVAAARPIYIDALVFNRIMVEDNSAGVFRWDPPLVENHYARYDRPYFTRLTTGCGEVGRHPSRGTTFVVIYDCEERR